MDLIGRNVPSARPFLVIRGRSDHYLLLPTFYTFQNETHDGVIGRELFLCFTRVVDRHQVATCAQDVSIESLDAWTLLDVMVCNDDINDSWVIDHVNPRDLPPPPQPV